MVYDGVIKDTVDIVITGLFPLLLLGLYNGFEDDKKKPFTHINKFDDFIIFISIIIFPFITGIEWYDHYSKVNQKIFFGEYSFMMVCGLISYIVYCKCYDKKKSDHHMSFLLIHFISDLFIISSWLGYYMIIFGDIPHGSNGFIYISNYCKENFTYERCSGLNISNQVIFYTCPGVIIVDVYFQLRKHRWSKSDKFKHLMKKFRTLGTICNHLIIITLIVYPAIVSGWLLSTNSVTTKLAFGICSISLSRLIEHFGDDEPKTIISCYLN